MKRNGILFFLFFIALTSCLFPGCSHCPDMQFPPSDGLLVLFLDVGQADCTLLIQEEHAMLIDTATEDQYETIADHLACAGITSLDALILTHPHADHIGSAAEILENYPVEQIFLPEATATTTTFSLTLDTILEHHIPASAPEPGDHFQFGDATLTFLSPPNGKTFSDLNDSSLVFLLEYDGFRILFTGDAGITVEEQILESGWDIQCDLIKVPHHGSDTASSADFLHAASPDWAVFTTEEDSPDGLPDEDVVSRYETLGAGLFFTHQDGDIVVEISDSTFTVERLSAAFMN